MKMLYMLQYKNKFTEWTMDWYYWDIQKAKKVLKIRNLNKFAGEKYRISMYKLVKENLLEE